MRIFQAIIIGLLLLEINSKFVSKVFEQEDFKTNEKFLFLTKFDFGPNGGNIKIRSQHSLQTDNQQQMSITIDIVLEDLLLKYLSAGTCTQRKPFVMRSQTMDFKKVINRIDRNIVIQPKQRQFIHYLYLAICQTGAQKFTQNEHQRLTFDLTLYNDESHFGQDQKLLTGYFVMVGLWIVMLVKFAIPIGKSIFKSNDKTKITIFSSIIVLGFSYFYRMLHLAIYYVNGEGLFIFQLFYIVLKTGCEFIIVTMIVAVSWGWSITHLNYDQAYLVAGVGASLVNVAGLTLNLFTEEFIDTHHKYDSMAGNVLLFLRILILVIFCIGVLRTYNTQVGNVRKFVKKLALVGGLYLGSWPFIVIFSQMFLPSYMHNQVITLTQQFAHLLASWLLCQMLAYPQSTYRKISLKDQDNAFMIGNYKTK